MLEHDGYDFNWNHQSTTLPENVKILTIDNSVAYINGNPVGVKLVKTENTYKLKVFTQFYCQD